MIAALHRPKRQVATADEYAASADSYRSESGHLSASACRRLPNDSRSVGFEGHRCPLIPCGGEVLRDGDGPRSAVRVSNLKEFYRAREAGSSEFFVSVA